MESQRLSRSSSNEVDPVPGRSRRGLFLFALLAGLLVAEQAHAYDVVGKDIRALEADMAAGKVTSVGLVQAYLDRIEVIDRQGPNLNAIISINPEALKDAAALDAERRVHGARGPLHGIPIVIKDNIETRDPLPTTGGSMALAHNVTGRDAPLIARLRQAGVIILGKTNLSEWGNVRSTHSISGWSAVGGLTRNPFYLDRSACGSSAGSAVAVAASLAAAALGAETNGSLICPATFNGVVAIKPTPGLVSRRYIIPISESQDTAGPMTHTVADAAIILTAMAGSDPADPLTARADSERQDYSALLARTDLKGVRLGVPGVVGTSNTDSLFSETIGKLRAAGAVIVPIPDYSVPLDLAKAAEPVSRAEFKTYLNAYLASLPDGQPHSLAELIAFNKASGRELSLFGQDYFEAAQASPSLPIGNYDNARSYLQDTMRALLDGLMQTYRLDAILRPTDDPAFRVDVVRGNRSGITTTPPALAGYVHLTVPMGAVQGLPVGLSLIARPWSEARLLALGAAVETLIGSHVVPQYLTSIEEQRNIETSFQPAR